MSLGLARLRRHAPGLVTIGLSATVADPDDLRAWLVPQAVRDDSVDGEAPDREDADTAERSGRAANPDSPSPRWGEGSAPWRAERALGDEGEGRATPAAAHAPLADADADGAEGLAPPHPDRSADAFRSDLSPPGRGEEEGDSRAPPWDAVPVAPAAGVEKPRDTPLALGRGIPVRRGLAPAAAAPALAYPTDGRGRRLAELVLVEGGAKPEIAILDSEQHIPWAGHTARYAYGDILKAIGEHRMSLVFVNTRSQAELIFQELWRINSGSLPIALHHGSLDAGQRRKVEAAMAAGQLRAVVCTSTLDLGIDWGDVDLVINVGAPKGASRLAQRIGRANHRLDEPSQAILVPANRFEVLECRAALDANYLGAQDTPPIRPGGLDVLAQHVLGMATAAPFTFEELFDEIRTASPYRDVDRETFERVVDFVATGGYALRSYERYAKIRKDKDGRWRVANPRIAQQYRLNVGTILEAPLLNVRMTRMSRNSVPLRGGRVLGKIEEYFIETLAPGDTFLFAGQILAFGGIRDNEVIATRTKDDTPKIPIYAGGKFPLTTYLAKGVRALVADPAEWHRLPDTVADWLRLQQERSLLPGTDQLLVETFPRGNRTYLVAYPFEGRLAHQTLGMLLTRRLERAHLKPMGFVASDYALGVWALGDIGAAFAAGTPTVDELFDRDMLGDDLEAWLAESYLLKRTFRNTALISGLVERRSPGQEKSGRQVTVSTDLVYDVLRRHEPDHILMRATWTDAAAGLLDVRRLSDMLSRISGRIIHKRLDRISPLAVPVMLDIGKESVGGEAREDILRDAAEDIIREAME
ncbi:MAG: DNA ligase-associated DEXH box helicase [Bauldia sp.]|nr:DNA ligase-associated DEXH box helicase [Bauldia sp.]